MQLTVRAILEIAHHEAIIRQAYKDSVGVWTWSVGITSASGHGVERYIGNPQSMQKCIEIYVWLLETKYLPSVLEAFEGHDLTESQLTAALSFHWNTGAIKRASWVKHFKAGNLSKARTSFMAWKKPSEIIPRRKAERDLFFDGEWSSAGTVTEFTRVTSRSTPDWSSGKKVNIEGAVIAAMGGDAADEEVQEVPHMQPVALMSEPIERPHVERENVDQTMTVWLAKAQKWWSGLNISSMGLIAGFRDLEPQVQFALLGVVGVVGVGGSIVLASLVRRERLKHFNAGVK